MDLPLLLCVCVSVCAILPLLSNYILLSLIYNICLYNLEQWREYRIVSVFYFIVNVLKMQACVESRLRILPFLMVME